MLITSEIRHTIADARFILSSLFAPRSSHNYNNNPLIKICIESINAQNYQKMIVEIQQNKNITRT